MHLTPYYKKIISVFDSPVKFYGVVSHENYFFVGKFKYKLEIDPGDRRDYYIVSFETVDFFGSDAEKIALIKQWTKKDWTPDFLSAENLDKNFDMILRTRSFGVLGTGSASQVFSHVIYLLEQFAKKYHVACYRFGGHGKSRVKLYSTLMRYFERRGFQTKIKPGMGDSASYWVCYP